MIYLLDPWTSLSPTPCRILFATSDHLAPDLGSVFRISPSPTPYWFCLLWTDYLVSNSALEINLFFAYSNSDSVSCIWVHACHSASPDSLPRKEWKLARVVEAKPSADGMGRKMKLLMSHLRCFISRVFVSRFLPDPFLTCLLFLWPECMCDWLIGKHVNQLFVFIFLCWPKPTEPVWTGSEGQPSVLLYKILMFDCSPSSLWVPCDSLCWSFLQKAPIKYT